MKEKYDSTAEERESAIRFITGTLPEFTTVVQIIAGTSTQQFEFEGNRLKSVKAAKDFANETLVFQGIDVLFTRSIHLSEDVYLLQYYVEENGE